MLISHLSPKRPLLGVVGDFGALGTNSVVVEALDREVLLVLLLLHLVLDLLCMEVTLIGANLVRVLLEALVVSCESRCFGILVCRLGESLLIRHVLLLQNTFIAVLTLNPHKLRSTAGLLLVHSVRHLDLLHLLGI